MRRIQAVVRECRREAPWSVVGALVRRAPPLHVAAAVLIGTTVAVVSCTANPTQPTPLEPSDSRGPQLAVLNEQPWNAVTSQGWSYLRRTSSRDADIVTDATAPVSPPNVVRMVFTPGMAVNTEPGVHWIRLPGAREVHVSWWLKLSAGWAPSPAGAAKMTFLHAQPDSRGQVYSALGGSQPPHSMIVNTEWAPYGERVWAPNAVTTPITYGRWYRFDWYVKWESAPGAADGILRWWVDGVLNGEYNRVGFPAATGFQQFEFAPTVQKSPPAEQYLYVDHTSIRTGTP